MTAADDGHYRDARRRANESTMAALLAGKAPPERVELACECINEVCDRSVQIPVYVYRRMLAAGDQYLVRPGHHVSPRYRTIVTTADAVIEERRV